MNRYLRRHYHLTPHQAKIILDEMIRRKMLEPETRRGKPYWVSTTVSTAEKTLQKILDEGPINKRRLLTEVQPSYSVMTRALERLVQRGILIETITRCPVAPEEGAKEMRVYSIERPTRQQIRQIREQIQAQIPESERIYGETVEEWLRREYGPEATIEKEWQIPGLGPENKFDYLVTLPDGTRIPVEMKGWRYEPKPRSQPE